jgi:hypothetical protein
MPQRTYQISAVQVSNDYIYAFSTGIKDVDYFVVQRYSVKTDSWNMLKIDPEYRELLAV